MRSHARAETARRRARVRCGGVVAQGRAAREAGSLGGRRGVPAEGRSAGGAASVPGLDAGDGREVGVGPGAARAGPRRRRYPQEGAAAWVGVPQPAAVPRAVGLHAGRRESLQCGSHRKPVSWICFLV